MIDFRYHIVSLISVFLALAVGIVLGAGPLKEAIGDQLSGQVDVLRADTEQLRSSLDQTEVDLNGRDAFLTEIASDVLVDTLPGRRVAIVELEEIPQEIIDDLGSSLETAGASVSMQAQLHDDWVGDGQAKFRQSLASSLVQYLDPAPSDQGADADLAAALVQSLTSLKPGDENVFSDSAKDLQGLLAAGELVTYKTDDGLPADMLVLVSLPPEQPDDASETNGPEEQRANAVRIQTKLAQAAEERTEFSVVVSATPSTNDLLAAIRSDKTLEKTISTVARGEELPGRMNTVLALAAGATGVVGQFGDQPKATGAAPQIVRLEEVDRASRFETVPPPDLAGELNGEEPGEDDPGESDDAESDASESETAESDADDADEGS